VFDPLAVVLLLASQYSFQWFRKAREDDELAMAINPIIPGVEERPFTEEEIKALDTPIDTNADDPIPCYMCGTPMVNAPGIGLVCPNKECDIIDEVPAEEPAEEPAIIVTPEIAVIEEPQIDPIDEEDDPTDSAEIKKAKAKWKAENPHTTLKEQRKLLASGIITVNPWEKYLEPHADFTDDEAAEEAAKWAQEQLDLKKKVVSWMERVGSEQVVKTLEK